MFRLLLDEHISPRVAGQVQAKLPKATIESVHRWNGGRLRQQSDERILLEARQEGWTLLTFDLATIPLLLAEMTRLGEHHGGVIFVSTKSFPQNDYGGLVKALVSSRPDWETQDWSNRVEFLGRT